MTLAAPLAAFGVRSFRFQWPADLLTSWAFEMETIILGWYVLVETDSVLWLTVFGSLQFLGTLLAPMLGVFGDRFGRRATLCTLRACYATLAATLMTLGLTGALSSAFVFAVAFLAGLVRPSDLVMRNALIGDTMPPTLLMNGMSIARTTMDSARIAGALAGAGLFSALGLGWAYVFVTSFYALSFLLTLGVAPGIGAAQGGTEVRPPPTAWRDLKEGLLYVWRTPQVLATMWLAFSVNLTAYPMTHGLLPYVAREVYRIDENGLGHLVAAFASGALVGSIAMAVGVRSGRPARLMLLTVLAWYLLLLVFGHMQSKTSGAAMLLVIGLAQSFAMVTMAVTLLAMVPQQFRARVMGVRMLAVYGLPVGLLASGVFVRWLGYPGAVTLYALIGIAILLAIALRWRATLWHG
jgi:MFS family permease